MDSDVRLTRKNPELLPLPVPEQIAPETLSEQLAAREIAFPADVPDVVASARDRVITKPRIHDTRVIPSES